jgi:hypothetical protein
MVVFCDNRSVVILLCMIVLVTHTLLLLPKVTLWSSSSVFFAIGSIIVRARWNRSSRLSSGDPRGHETTVCRYEWLYLICRNRDDRSVVIFKVLATHTLLLLPKVTLWSSSILLFAIRSTSSRRWNRSFVPSFS